MSSEHPPVISNDVERVTIRQDGDSVIVEVISQVTVDGKWVKWTLVLEPQEALEAYHQMGKAISELTIKA